MMNVALGLSLAIGGGLGQGTYGLPLKYTKGWNWENTWSLWSLWALIIIPWLMAFITVKDLMGTYFQAPPGTLCMVFLFGVLWGLGGVTFGLALDRVGLALTYGIIIGMTSAIGSLIPLFMRAESATYTATLVIITAVLICLIGVVIVSYSGGLKEKAQVKKNQSWKMGLAICVFSGVMSPMLNIGFVRGEELSELARDAGTSSLWSSLPIWSLALTGGFLVNICYCIYLLHKNRSAKLYSKGGVNWFYPFLMGLLWFGGMMLYGVGATAMGSLGPSIGWPTMMGVMIISANIAGYLTGEWKGAKGKPLRIMSLGVFTIMASICLFGYAATL